MSRSVSDRKNRRDNSGRHTEMMLGAMVDVTTYNGNVRMCDVKAAVPGSARMAGRMADGLLPEGQ